MQAAKQAAKIECGRKCMTWFADPARVSLPHWLPGEKKDSRGRCMAGIQTVVCRMIAKWMRRNHEGEISDDRCLAFMNRIALVSVRGSPSELGKTLGWAIEDGTGRILSLTQEEAESDFAACLYTATEAWAWKPTQPRRNGRRESGSETGETHGLKDEAAECKTASERSEISEHAPVEERKEAEDQEAKTEYNKTLVGSLWATERPRNSPLVYRLVGFARNRALLESVPLLLAPRSCVVDGEWLDRHPACSTTTATPLHIQGIMYERGGISVLGDTAHPVAADRRYAW